MLSLLKPLWAGLIPLGPLFIALEIRCGFDRCFRYFGIAQLFAIEAGGWASVAGLLEELIRKDFPAFLIRFLPDPGSLETRIRGDAGKLEQVFRNLIQKAREAGASLITVPCIHTHNVLAVSIEDDGSGSLAEARGIPILSPHAEFRSKAARGAKNLLLVPMEFPSPRPADIPPCDLILQEEVPESRSLAPVRDRGARVLRVRPDGYARPLSPDEAVLDAGLFCETFLAGCL